MIGHGKLIIQTLLQPSARIVCSNKHIRAMSAQTPTVLAGDVIFQESEKAGIMILNRPKGLNAINLLMTHAMTRQIEEFERHKSMIITKSSVPKIFCAGGDIIGIHDLEKSKDPTSMYFLRYGYGIVHWIATAKVPYIALVDGVSMGGGAGMSMLGKYLVCTENTDFAMPEARLGLTADVGASFYMPRLKNHVGFYLALTGTRVKGYDNVHVGTATHYCESARLPELENALRTTDDIEGTLNSICSKPENSKYSLEPYVEKIDRIFSSKTAEEILKKLEEDGSPWAKKTASILRYVCPLSVKGTLHNLQVGRDSTLEDCLRNEYVLAHTFFRGENFFEGVRAQLKEKDNKPKWNPRTLEEVTPEMIENMYKVQPHFGPILLRSETRGMQ